MAQRPSPALLARIQPLMDEIDLERDVTEHVSYIATVGAMGGTEPSDMAKKLSLLKERGQITNEEYRLILVEHHDLS